MSELNEDFGPSELDMAYYLVLYEMQNIVIYCFIIAIIGNVTRFPQVCARKNILCSHVS